MGNVKLINGGRKNGRIFEENIKLKQALDEIYKLASTLKSCRCEDCNCCNGCFDENYLSIQRIIERVREI